MASGRLRVGDVVIRAVHVAAFGAARRQGGGKQQPGKPGAAEGAEAWGLSIESWFSGRAVCGPAFSCLSQWWVGGLGPFLCILRLLPQRRENFAFATCALCETASCPFVCGVVPLWAVGLNLT